MTNTPKKSEAKKALAYATGLLVGDMWLQRNSNDASDSSAIEVFRDEWAEKLLVKASPSEISSEWDRGFDRALAAPLPKGKIRRGPDDNALAIAARISVQASAVSAMLGGLDRVDPHVQKEILEACSRLMRDMDERLASVAGLPDLPK